METRLQPTNGEEIGAISPRELGSNRRSAFENNGIAVFGPNKSPLSYGGYLRLNELSKSEGHHWENVRDGDTGDKHTVRVGRIVRCAVGELPYSTSDESQNIASILMSKEMQDFYQGLLGTDSPLYIRRSQYNILTPGGFVGPRIDNHADPDIQAVVILHFDSHYTGGRYVVVPPHSDEPLKFEPVAGTLLFSRTDVNHWVEPVETGNRKTLVTFLSTYDGPNRRIEN